MINIMNFNSHLLKIDKVSFKSSDTVIYNIRYITMKSLGHVNIDSENPLYLIFNNVDGYIEESNRDEYLTFASRTKTKKYWQNTQKFGIKLKIKLKQ